MAKKWCAPLEIIPARTIVREDVYYTYACKSCSENADEGCETPMVKAPKEKNIIPGSFATPEAVAHIMTQKFVMGCPLYRQEQDLNRRGIPLSRQTMSNWILRATENDLTPVYEQMHKELLRREVLHADETTLQVLHEPGKAPQSESYMWLYRTSGDTNKPIVLYEYQPGRGAKHPEAFLKGFKGYLHTDGYAGYHNLPEEITVVGCWAHARRKFDEAVRSLPKGKAKGSSASQGLTYCNLLFRMEQEIADKTAEERYEERLKQAKPVLDAMFAWANSRTAAPKSALGKALNYLKEQWPYLTNYLKDGRLELSNNRAERSIKPFVIDRKNFLFANTPKGAAGSAVMFSLIQTTMENGLDPYRYLTWLMHTANHADLTDTQVVLWDKVCCPGMRRLNCIPLKQMNEQWLTAVGDPAKLSTAVISMETLLQKAGKQTRDVDLMRLHLTVTQLGNTARLPETIRAHFDDLGAAPEDFDLIVTGDLGKVGKEILLDQFHQIGVRLEDRYTDCGVLVFDLEGQDVHAGGSGCGCSAIVLCGYLLNQLSQGKLHRILFCGTGALLSPTSSQQGESIPGVCHAVSISTEGK